MTLPPKSLPANAGDSEDKGSVPGLKRFPGGESGYPLQYYCWDNPMDEEPGGLQSIEL